MGNPDLAHLPTAEEYALFREAYAETYPVRPLMNAIDAKDAEIARLTDQKELFHALAGVYKAVVAKHEATIATLRDAAIGVMFLQLRQHRTDFAAFGQPCRQFPFVHRLGRDLADGSWDRRYGHFRTQPQLDGPLRLIVS